MNSRLSLALAGIFAIVPLSFEGTTAEKPPLDYYACRIHVSATSTSISEGASTGFDATQDNCAIGSETPFQYGYTAFFASWSSSDTTVATVNGSIGSHQTVTGVSAGTAVITAQICYAPGACRYDSETITVNDTLGMPIVTAAYDYPNGITATWTAVSGATQYTVRVYEYCTDWTMDGYFSYQIHEDTSTSDTEIGLSSNSICPQNVPHYKDVWVRATNGSAIGAWGAVFNVYYP